MNWKPANRPSLLDAHPLPSGTHRRPRIAPNRWMVSLLCTLTFIATFIGVLGLTPTPLHARTRDPIDPPIDPIVTATASQFPQTASVAAAQAELSVVDTLYGDLGLRQAFHSAISPDDLHIYVAAIDSNALVLLARDAASNTLDYVATYRDNKGHVDGLNGARFVSVSPDGNNVYVAGEFDHAIAVFSRNATTGRLTFLQVVRNDENDVQGLQNPTSVVVDPTGTHAYVTSGLDQSVNLFTRNQTDGSLTYVRSYQNGQGNIAGLDGAQVLILSNNGRQAYVASREENSVVTFNRDTTTGELTFVESVGAADDELGGVEGLEGARSLAISADGKNIYVAALAAGAVVVFARDIPTGKLTPVETIFDPTLFAATDVAVSADGNNVYAVAFGGLSITTFTRAPGTGKLQTVEVLTVEETGIAGLRGPTSVTLNSDSSDVIVTGLIPGAVTIFDRTLADGKLVEADTQNNVSDSQSNPLYGLQADLATTVSPDGKHIYVDGVARDTIVAFTRNATNGMVSQVQTIENGPGSESGLVSLQALAFSPDGKHLYVPGLFSNNIAIFARNPMTGSLTFIDSVQDGQDGVTGLESTYRVSVSPDGKHVYALGYLGGKVVVFSRDSASGLLTFIEAVDVSVTPGPRIVGNPSAIAIHPEGKTVYVTVQNTGSLLVFARDTSTGKLTRIQQIRNGVDGVAGLSDATTVTIPNDAAHLYAAGPDSDGIAVFTVDPTDGTLAYSLLIPVNEPTTALASPDGNLVSVVSRQEGKLTLFGRDTETGILLLADEKQNGDDGVNGLEQPTDLTFSPDSRFIYVPGGLGNSLFVFTQDGDLPSSLHTYLPIIGGR